MLINSEKDSTDNQVRILEDTLASQTIFFAP